MFLCVCFRFSLFISALLPQFVCLFLFCFPSLWGFYLFIYIFFLPFFSKLAVKFVPPLTPTPLFFFTFSMTVFVFVAGVHFYFLRSTASCDNVVVTTRLQNVGDKLEETRSGLVSTYASRLCISVFFKSKKQRSL